jgi:antitoxin component YwqK of YwqJK toxin-antitoxin module
MTAVEQEIQEIKMPEIVYGLCHKRWIVTLKTLDDTITNISRPLLPIGIANAQYAKFRGNKFMVVMIENKHHHATTIESISNNHTDTIITYKTGEVIEVPNYDMELNKICSTGIYFFLSREAAFHHECDGHDGMVFAYHDNGVKKLESTCVYGAQHGPYIKYYENGNKKSELTYLNGKKHGSCVGYYENGNKKAECTFINNKKHGLSITYYENGNKELLFTYMHGMIHGLYIEYYDNGNRKYEIAHVNGNQHGPSIGYNENGDVVTTYALLTRSPG